MLTSNPARGLFEIAQPGVFHGAYLGRVTSVQDPDSLSRVQVRVLNCDGLADQDAEIWARVAVPFAGNNMGAFFIPNVDDEVLITFLNGDSRFPIVIGSLWNGSDSPPEQIGGDSIDRWSFVGKNGSRIAIVEESQGQAKIEISTPGEVSLTLKETGGGAVEIEAAQSKITIDSSGITLNTPSTVTVQASQVQVTSGQVTVNAGLSTFSGVVKCDVLQATTVIATTYTPGVGNIW